MKLFTAGRAPNPRRVNIFFAEKGFRADEIVEVDLNKLEHKQGELASVNSFQRVPVLVLDDGTVIAESVAICRYVEEALVPEPKLFGRDAKERALVDMWNRRAELVLMAQAAAIFRHLHPGAAALEVPQVPAWGEVNKERVAETFVLFDRELEGRACIAGDHFTIADITAYIAIDFLKVSKIRISEATPHLKRWYDAVSERPSAKA